MANGANSLDKLPEFATNPQDNTFDSAIINKTSTLEQTGFVPNTTIKSSQMNTYMKTMVEALRGIVDGLYRDGTQQGIIKANSTAQEWEDYLQKGLNDLIVKTKTDNAVHADKSTNVDNIVNNNGGNNANVNFSIGDKNFSKTVNNVANSYACSGNAASATKLANTRTINIGGDATGTAQGFNGESNIMIPIDVHKSAALDSTNIGDASHAVYFDNNGKPVKVDVVAEASHATSSDNATFATQASHATSSDNAITAIQAKDAVDETAHKFAFVTQAKYDELKAANTLASNCLYYIIDDSTETDIMQAIDTVKGTADQALELASSNKTDIGKLDQKIKTATIETSVSWTSSDTSIHNTRHDDSGITSAKVSIPYGAQIKSITISDVKSSAEYAKNPSMFVRTIDASDAISLNFTHELTISVGAYETIGKGTHGTVSGTLALTYLFMQD